MNSEVSERPDEQSDDFEIIVDTTLAPGELQQHAFLPGVFRVRANEVVADWPKAIHRLAEVVSKAAQSSVAGWELSQLEVSLAVTAEGHLAFVSKVGLQGTVKVTFQRNTSDSAP
jgi:hypothetical protein